MIQRSLSRQVGSFIIEALVSLALEGFRPLRVLREGEWIAILAERA